MELAPERHQLRGIINQRIQKYLPAEIEMGDQNQEAHKLLLSIYPDLLYLMFYNREHPLPTQSKEESDILTCQQCPEVKPLYCLCKEQQDPNYPKVYFFIRTLREAIRNPPDERYHLIKWIRGLMQEDTETMHKLLERKEYRLKVRDLKFKAAGFRRRWVHYIYNYIATRRPKKPQDS